MSELFSFINGEAILNWLGELHPAGVYLTLAVSAVIENIFPPFPGDLITVIGGVVMSQGVVEPLWCMVALIVGNLCGAYTMYYTGSHFLIFIRRIEQKIKRPQLLKKVIQELTCEKSISRAHYWFDHRGIYFVLFSRFSAGIRFFVSIIAGLSQMNPLLFGLFFTLGVIIWNTLLLSGGNFLGREWHQVMHWLRIYNMVVLTIIVIIVAIVLKIKLDKLSAEKEGS